MRMRIKLDRVYIISDIHLMQYYFILSFNYDYSDAQLLAKN